MTALAPSPSSGILAGDGSAMVHAFVYHHAVPQQPPADFADLAEPVRNAEGQVQDWQLSMGALLAHREAPVHELWARFAAWRRTYVAERVVGDRATVRSFLAWADHHTDVSSLHVLDLHAGRVEPAMTPTVAFQAGEAEAVCRASGDTGLGITVPQRPGLVRGFLVVGAEPVVLLADARGTSVAATPAGLAVTDPALPGRAGPLLVHGWLVGADGVTAVCDEGPVGLDPAGAGRLLAALAPGCTHVAAAPAPLASILAPLFLGLREAATMASADLLPLYVRTGPAH